MESLGYIFDINLVIRVLSALLLGFAIGLEREMTNKYAGLRTNILVCLGACIFTIISIYGFPTFADGDNVIVSQATGVRDTARIAAQVVTGIGFIGGGTVLRHGATVFWLDDSSYSLGFCRSWYGVWGRNVRLGSCCNNFINYGFGIC